MRVPAGAMIFRFAARCQLACYVGMRMTHNDWMDRSKSQCGLLITHSDWRTPQYQSTITTTT